MTREHVFGKWMSTIGLDLTPVQHNAGPLNRIPRNMGEHPPFLQRVKDVCAACNNGWMSQLETIAQRVLSPLILGEPGTILLKDQPAIALWAQKTALTAMLLSSEQQRNAGYGLPRAMYTEMYERRGLLQPLAASRFWVGRYYGAEQFSAVRVAPMAVRIRDVPEPDVPQGYTMTIVVGELVLFGLVYTTPSLAIEATLDLEMAQLWPSDKTVEWPVGHPCTEGSFLHLADGKMLSSVLEHVEIRPWTKATQVGQSRVIDGRVRVPAICGKHDYAYPLALLEEAFRGRFYAFATSCECSVAYLIQMEADGAHCKAAGAFEGISQMYSDLRGEEFFFEDGVGFCCKQLPVTTTVTDRT